VKLSKQQFKLMVKECLVEILAEGIGEKSMNEALKREPTPAKLADTYVPPKQRPTSPNLHEIPSIVSNVTKDPIMASILAETAKTTLVQQEQADRRTMPPSGFGADRATMVMANVEPADVFDEATMNMWARAAFEPKKS
jgi:hypothetical protein